MRSSVTSSQSSDASGLASTLQLLMSLLLSGQEKGISRLSANKHNTQNACSYIYSKIKIKFKQVLLIICPLGDESGVLLDSSLFNSSDDFTTSDLASSEDKTTSSDTTFSGFVGLVWFKLEFSSSSVCVSNFDVVFFAKWLSRNCLIVSC